MFRVAPDTGMALEAPGTVSARPVAGFPYLVVGAYVIAQIVLFAFHEPWRDEGQAWLVAQQLATPLEFLVIPGEGHPPLWFWLLRGASTFLSFDTARTLGILVAVTNALLLGKLLEDRPLILLLVLSSLPVLHAWGFHFRPYGLVFTCTLSALLLERNGRWRAATWLMAIACGLHFYAGLLFAFWLFLQLWQRRPVLALLAPAVLAAAFGLSAILSGADNPDASVVLADWPAQVLRSLTQPFALTILPPLLGLALIVGAMAALFWHQPVLGIVVSVLGATFAVVTALVYPPYPWHSAFILVLVLMAAIWWRRAPVWPLIALLLPQAILGAVTSGNEIRELSSSEGPPYAAVLADAGDRLDPPSNLVVWPDFTLTATAASKGIAYLGGSSGALVTATDWRADPGRTVDTDLFRSLPTPYWLVCVACEHPLDALGGTDREAVLVFSPTPDMPEHLFVYRIESR